MHYILHTEEYTLYSTHCKLYTVHYTLHTAHYTALYVVQSAELRRSAERKSEHNMSGAHSGFA